MKKTAIITGGSRGIGYAITRQLGEDGFQVVMVATQEEAKYQKQLAALREKGIDCLYLQGDISSSLDRSKIIEETLSHFGGIQVLINNAGVAPKIRTDLLEMTEESFDHVIGINTKGTMFFTQAVANQMLKQSIAGKKRGTIINISSCSAEVSSVNRGEYCVSKAGISMLTLLYADRLAAEGIFVHEIRPGIIETDMTAAVKDKYDDVFQSGVFPIRRWGQPEDVAQAVSVFCSDAFTYTTGNYIDVDGGFHIKRL